MTRQDIFVTASTFIGAGSETTASLLCNFTWYLLRKPDCLARVQHKVRAACEAKEDVNLQIVGELGYFLAVVNEAFQESPTALAGQPRRAPPEG